MIACQSFRANLQSREPEVLEHLRKCDACLDFAVRKDPDLFFRAIGGEELVPPGGIDAFAADVMAQVRLRQAEGSVARRFLVPPRRLAAAAALIVAVGISALVYDGGRRTVAVRPVSVATFKPLTTKPVVETYQSPNATIVEVPSEGKGEAQVVMIFDDSLPADL